MSASRIEELEETNLVLAGRVRELADENLALNDKIRALIGDRHKLLKREVIHGLYHAVEHHPNAGRLSTFRWLRTQTPLLQLIFGRSRQQTEDPDLLEFLDPLSLTMTSNNKALHRFTLADAMSAVGENEAPARDFIGFLIEQYGESTIIHEAAERLREDLASKFPGIIWGAAGSVGSGC